MHGETMKLVKNLFYLTEALGVRNPLST